MDFVTVNQVTFPALHEAASDAFSDYVIPAQLSEAQWTGMLTQRSFTPELSYVAMEDGVPVAYWLTGTTPARPGIGYAISVGTRPRARRRGLSQQLFERVRDNLKARGYTSMLHEVITNNTGAVKLYEALGYSPARRVKCFKGPVKEALRLPEGAAVHEVTIDEAERIAETVGGWQPTWQNDFHAMRQPGEVCKAFAIKLDGETAGYGVVVPAYRQITQIGIRPDHRRKGLGAGLLAHWRDKHGFDTAGILNVPDTDPTMLGFAAAMGWDNNVDQFEMARAI